MPYMKSLTACLNRMLRDGYTEDFKITDEGLKSFNRHYNYKPEEITVVSFFRFEGESDPSDNAILYVIETNDGTKGTLVDSYGAYSDPKISEFMKDIAIHKKTTRN